MTRAARARLLTLSVLAALLLFAVARRIPLGERLSAPARAQEQDAVYAMFDAAKEGRVDAYLDAYTGALRASIEQAAREQGTGKFAAYLRAQTAAVKGLAIQAPQKLSATQSRLPVEYVYQDRSEAQTMTLELAGGVWRILAIDAAERVQTLVPYGTRVY